MRLNTPTSPIFTLNIEPSAAIALIAALYLCKLGVDWLSEPSKSSQKAPASPVNGGLFAKVKSPRQEYPCNTLDEAVGACL